MTGDVRFDGLDVDVAACMVDFGLYLKGRGERPANPRRFGPAGFRFFIAARKGHTDEYRMVGSVIITQADHDGEEWIHASIARRRDPDYADLAALKHAVWGPDGYAYQVFAGQAEHVNIHEHALHLWGRADGGRVLPAFGAHGTI